MQVFTNFGALSTIVHILLWFESFTENHTVIMPLGLAKNFGRFYKVGRDRGSKCRHFYQTIECPLNFGFRAKKPGCLLYGGATISYLPCRWTRAHVIRGRGLTGTYIEKRPRAQT